MYNNVNQITPTNKVATIKTKRKWNLSSKNKNKKNKLSTYTFNPSNLLTMTSTKMIKEVTLAQINEVTIKDPPPQKKRNTIHKKIPNFRWEVLP